MICTRTPLRISFCGGGTDLPAFFHQHDGAVVSMAIDKYVYVSINKKFDGRIRLSYSKTENVDEPGELKHDLARAYLEMFGLKGVEITSVSDIPGAGSGLGSSSSFTVGLLNAIFKHTDSEWAQSSCNKSPHCLAEMAYMAELGCGHSVGKQDHYAAAYGGLHFYQFKKDGSVVVEPLFLEAEEKIAFREQTMLFWTGKTRKASDILKKQSDNLSSGKTMDTALKMRDLAYELRANLRAGGIYTLGELLNRNWELKKELASGISDRWIESVYQKAKEAGAMGGKLCGAGGGGFLFLCAEPRKQAAVREAVGLRQVGFEMEEDGSKVIYGK